MDLTNLNVLVTGGAGFIGSNIVEYLLKNNIKKVRVIDNLSTGNKNNLQPFLEKFDNLEFMYGDISKLEDCRKAVKGMDVITNQAALGSVPRSINDPLSSHISNVSGFLNILIAAKEEGIKRVVYASSSSVYGDNPTLPKVEENTGNVLSPYAATKAIDEIYAGVFSKCYNMECIGLRYFNVFGPRQDPNGAYAAVIPKFIDIMKKREIPTINGDGSFSRDFTYIDNVVQGNINALTTKNTECFGEAFNIGAGGRVTLLELVDAINKGLNINIEPKFGPDRAGDIPHSNACVDKARNMLGYNPEISFEEGILKTIKHYNENNFISKINPAVILSKDKEDYILDYLLNKEENVCVYINKSNSDLCKRFLIPGNRELLTLNYEINKEIYDNEKKFGIVSYINESFEYGKLGKIPTYPSDVGEPIRILISEKIHNDLQEIFKKLTVVNTKYHEIDYKHMTIIELLELTETNNYKSIINNGKSLDTIERNYGLYGKYYNALHFYQERKKSKLTEEQKNLAIWYTEYNIINDRLSQYITNNLNSLFKFKKKFLFQKNNPIRISLKGSTGTPLHQDSQSILIKKHDINNFKNGSFTPKNIDNKKILIETCQCEKIFNFNYTIFEEFPEHAMRICENKINNIQDKSYFFRVKQNNIREGFLFNPSNRLHYRSGQYKGISIRGDVRIIMLEDYEKSNLQFVLGPRQNSDVCFGKESDCHNKNTIFSVFKNKIYE